MVAHTIHSKTQGQTSACSCPACLGLECLERPRYFAGQLLTEAELNSEQTYVLAKNRLHNRYLHGWGVVCGLPVVCHECEGWVTVKQGYAIDPCGNDIIVCKDHEINIIDLIRKCKDSRRKRRRSDCDPIRPATDASCQDIEEHWCLTIAYEEQEARPTTTLRRDKSKSCGCGNGNGHSCGCHDTQTEQATQATARTRNGAAQPVTTCEPTRIFENYRLDIVEEPADHCEPRLDASQYRRWANCEFLPQQLRAVLPSLLAISKDTLLERVLACLLPLCNFMQERLPTPHRETLGRMYLAQLGGVQEGAELPPAQSQYDAYCRLWRAVHDLYTENPFNVHCELLHFLNTVACPSPAPNDTPDNYIAVIRPSLNQLAGLLLQYALDCVCMALLPSCPPNPQDDRLILACLTIKNDKIIQICNFSCRRYAGAFPSLFYWLSLVPIVPLIGYAVRYVCCEPDILQALLRWVGRYDPNKRLVRAFAADNFAVPRMYTAKVQEIFKNVSLGNLVERLRPRTVNLTGLVGQPPEQVNAALYEAGVAAVEREVASADEVLTLRNLVDLPLAAPGDRVMVYKMGNKVLGFRRYDVHEELADKQIELNTIREHLTTLTREVETLKGAKPGSRGRKKS